jgi:hypothetical protein
VKARIARSLGATFAALTIAGGALIGLPVAAQADGGCPLTDFCALADQDVGPFGWYATPGNGAAWPASVHNRVDWVGNAGTTGKVVDIFYSANYSGAYACIGPNTGWNLRGDGYHFNWTKNGNTSGLNKSVHDDAASHRWTYSCGNNNF